MAVLVVLEVVAVISFVAGIVLSTVAWVLDECCSIGAYRAADIMWKIGIVLTSVSALILLAFVVGGLISALIS